VGWMGLDVNRVQSSEKTVKKLIKKPETVEVPGCTIAPDLLPRIVPEPKKVAVTVKLGGDHSSVNSSVVGAIGSACDVSPFKSKNRRALSAVHLRFQVKLDSPQVNRAKPKIKVGALSKHWDVRSCLFALTTDNRNKDCKI